VKQSAAARPGGATQRTRTLPDRTGNLADRKPEHNRRTSRSPAAKLPRFRHVDLWISCQYARQDFPTPRTGREAIMTTTFDKREEGFEKKFAHDEELRFKANARRNRMLGMWAAEKLGLTGDAATAYAKEVVMSDFEEGGEHDVLKKVNMDLEAKGVAASEQEIGRAMTDFMEKAIAQIKAS
jgi:hypothetical protein